MNAQDKEDSVTLQILETIERQDDVSQRHLANHLGVALGLANLYLKRCIRKGLIKVHQAPANRYLYYLTPKGFAEKSRLTAEYLTVSFNFYRRAGDSCARVLQICRERGFQHMLLCGVSELAEIASLRADEHGVQIIGTFDPASDKPRFVGKPVWRQLADVPKYDCCMLTVIHDPLKMHDALASSIDPDRILVPDVLGLKGKTRSAEVALRRA